MATMTKPITEITESEHARLVAQTQQRRRWENILIDKVAVYFVLGILLFFAIFPFLWMFSTSIKTPEEQFVNPPRWIPQHITFKAYRALWDPLAANNNYFPRYFLNSLIVGVGTTVLALLVAIPAAYAFSRFAFPGKGPLFFAVLGRNTFPIVAFLVPLYQLFVVLHLQNSYAGLIVAYLTISLPLAIWLLKGFFDGIPNELEKAARIDGATRFGAFVRIIIPLSAPGVVATAIYSFIQAWDEYLIAVVLTNSPQLRTLTVGQASFISENTANWAGLMAVTLVISIPVVVGFMLLQRFFIQALTQGAVKG